MKKKKRIEIIGYKIGYVIGVAIVAIIAEIITFCGLILLLYLFGCSGETNLCISSIVAVAVAAFIVIGVLNDKNKKGGV